MKKQLIVKGPRDLIFVGLIVLSFSLVTVAQRRPGSLDSSFGSGGLVSAPAIYNFYYWADDVAIQDDGKIVVSGVAGYPCANPGTWNVHCHIYLARFHTNGQPDTTFGSGGQIIVDPGRPAGLDRYGSHMALQPDGKIVVVGSASEQFVMRFLSNGTLDTTFDQDGKLTLTDLFLGDVAVQPDGKIVLAGWLGQNMNADFAAARLNADGSFDNSFGVNGISRTEFGNLSSAAYGLELQRDGKIVSIGTASDATGNPLALARYNVDGSLDTTFGSGGRAVTALYTDSTDDVVQVDDKLLVASNTGDGGILIRLDANGSLDTSFGNAGTVGYAGVWFSDIAVQPNGRIVVGGSVGYGAQHALVRYRPNGVPDTSFGNGGLVNTNFGDEGNLAMGGGTYALAIQPDGKLIAAGAWSIGGCGEQCFTWYSHPTIARYLSDSSCPFDFDGDRRADIAVFRPSDSVWYLNRSTAGFSATQFGLPPDGITPADYDGDGKTDIAVFRDGVWWLLKSSTDSVLAYPFGQSGDVPVPADYTGDGRDELAVYRNGQWLEVDLSNGALTTVSFGIATDKPVPADYDGDGEVDEAVYRNGEWHLNRSSLGYTVINFGLSGDRPVVGDYDGDSKADLAVYRNGTWYLQQSTAGFNSFQWGLPTDTPVPADYDGDGKTDATVFRDGVWYSRRSTAGILIQQFGLTGDRPIAASFIR